MPCTDIHMRAYAPARTHAHVGADPVRGAHKASTKQSKCCCASYSRTLLRCGRSSSVFTFPSLRLLSAWSCSFLLLHRLLCPLVLSDTACAAMSRSCPLLLQSNQIRRAPRGFASTAKQRSLTTTIATTLAQHVPSAVLSRRLTGLIFQIVAVWLALRAAPVTPVKLIVPLWRILTVARICRRIIIASASATGNISRMTVAPQPRTKAAAIQTLLMIGASSWTDATVLYMRRAANHGIGAPHHNRRTVCPRSSSQHCNS